MKKHRRTRAHNKHKAALGAFSARPQPLLIRRPAPAPVTGGAQMATTPSTATDRFLRELPFFGMPAITILEDGTVWRHG